MTSQTATPPPARGTRPRNRRALIVAAATDLFHRVGYAGVSMSDIAAAVNVQPSALYRHFESKSTLLAEAARVALEPTAELLERSESIDSDDLLQELVRVGLTNRAVGVLWQREARHLPADGYGEVRQELRRLAHLLANRLRRDRSELTADQVDQLAWSALAAVASLSFHDLQLPTAQFQALLYDVVRCIVRVEPPAADAVVPPRPSRLAVRSRRETLLAAASRLFTSRGYAAVTIDDIGDAAGIAGPSVYNHFESKQALLIAALNRGNEWLWMEVSRALAAAADERDALRRLLDSYLVLVLERGELIDVLIGDLAHVPEAERHRARQSQHDYISEWVELLRVLRPDLDATAARIQVQAALMIVNNTAQTPHLLSSPGAIPLLRAVVGSLLY